MVKKVAATPLSSIARVVDNLQAQTNDRTNAPSIHAVREAVNNNWLSIYPIGSIYMSVNNVNPSEIFGVLGSRLKTSFYLPAVILITMGLRAVVLLTAIRLRARLEIISLRLTRSPRIIIVYLQRAYKTVAALGVRAYKVRD